MDKKVIIYLLKYIFQTILIYIIFKNIVPNNEKLNQIILYLFIIQITFDILSNNKEFFTLTNNLFNNSNHENFSQESGQNNTNTQSETNNSSTQSSTNTNNNSSTENSTNIPNNESRKLKILLNELKNPGIKLKNDIYHLIKPSTDTYIFDNKEIFTVLFSGTKIYFKEKEYIYDTNDKIYYLNNDYTKNNFIKIIADNKFLTNIDNSVLKFISNTSKNDYTDKLKSNRKKKRKNMEKQSKKNLKESEKSNFMFHDENNIKKQDILYNDLYPEDQIKVAEKDLDKLSKNMKNNKKLNDDNDKYFFRINAKDKEKTLNEKKKKIPPSNWNETQDTIKRRFNKISKCHKTKYKDLEPTYGNPFSNF
jgi:hypothetical protein